MNVGQRRGRKISTLCSLLGYSRQAYYQQKRIQQQSVLEQDLIIEQVLSIRRQQKRVGTRKMHIMLQPFLSAHKIDIGRDALFTLLDERGLLIRKRRRNIPRTTFSNHWMRKYANLTIGVAVNEPNRLWVSDITYITLNSGFGYLSLVTDAYSRMIVGYYLSRDLSTSGCVKALMMALKQLPHGSMLIHHSDRGSQYCSTEYVEQLNARHVSISMTQNSDPRENAIAERVNGIIKQEFLDTIYTNYRHAVSGVAIAIKTYNNQRLHSSVDMLTPFEAHFMTGTLKRHWKSYYTLKKKEVIMT